MKKISIISEFSAFLGLLFNFPFLILNFIVGSKIEPILSFIRPTGHSSLQEILLLIFVLLLIPIGAYFLLEPVFAKDENGKRNYYLVNILFASIMLTAFFTISTALAIEIYRCEILKIPNCD